MRFSFVDSLTGETDGLKGYLNTGGHSATVAFSWLYNLSAITGIITWW